MITKPKWSSEDVKKFYSQNRIDWKQLYKSEQYMLEKSNISSNSNILDVGCACAGLYNILEKKFSIKSYFGVDINDQSIEYAKEKFLKNNKVSLLSADILELKNNINKKFNFVISFGYIDCSYDFYKSFEKCLEYLDENGNFIFDIRLTDKKDLLTIDESFQYLNYEGKKIGEKVPYNVVNYKNFTSYLNSQYPSCDYSSYGYDLTPSSNAILNYDTITFATFIFKKNGKGIRNSKLPKKLF
jgi:2-polyprenyl-3-methyl-5-hydroxy-6-metoxy-1,4-benzoquinol methylase